MMLNKISLRNILVVLGTAAMSLAVNAGPLNLSQGTWTAGGSASFTATKAAGANFDTMTYGMGAGVDVGYFVMDNWSVGGIVGMNMAFNPTFSFRNVYFGVGTNYYFDINSIVYPYLGMDVWGNARDLSTTAIWSIGVTPRVGMLIGLNCDVALDVGLSADLGWDVNGSYNNGNPSMNVELGYFGVRGFF